MDQQGFSLIELLVSLTIFSTAIFALAGMQQTAINGNEASAHMTTAVFLAEAKMNELQATGYSNLSFGPSDDSNNPINPRGASGGMFERSWNISQYGANMKKITVTVSWTDFVGSYRLISLDTVVSETMD